ncbi:putative ester cyclase [Blastococcus colisei]|uniref:Putative ester cyclase n=1 Tax=Blastococcus colisei TaxID=1564162 RepID=A0A543PA78_9ACTN|nr:ester cyclase [Blastococcus colisei]TQN40985.1 putative ester cyclase [Blastococcus colisei]
MEGAPAGAIHPLVRLAQRFTIDWLDRADGSVPPQIMTPDYQVHIGGIDLEGLEAYAPATLGQLTQFPGLQLTVHDLVTTGDRLALHFTEHGASARHEGRPAAWAGVALFRWDGERLAENWTQEDYAARRRQLADGQSDPVAAPMVAPWTVTPAASDPTAEVVVRDWLATAAPGGGDVRWDDGRDGPLIAPTGAGVVEIFSVGSRVAFAATQTGRFLGEGGSDEPVRLGLAGLVDVVDGSVARGVVISDRLGLLRARSRG